MYSPLALALMKSTVPSLSLGSNSFPGRLKSLAPSPMISMNAFNDRSRTAIRIRFLKGHEGPGAILLNRNVLGLEIHSDVGAQVGAELGNVVEPCGRDHRSSLHVDDADATRRIRRRIGRVGNGIGRAFVCHQQLAAVVSERQHVWQRSHGHGIADGQPRPGVVEDDDARHSGGRVVQPRSRAPPARCVWPRC